MPEVACAVRAAELPSDILRAQVLLAAVVDIAREVIAEAETFPATRQFQPYHFPESRDSSVTGTTFVGGGGFAIGREPLTEIWRGTKQAAKPSRDAVDADRQHSECRHDFKERSTKFRGGFMNVMCGGCSRWLISGLAKDAESRLHVLCILFCYFPHAPESLVYDFACACEGLCWQPPGGLRREE